MSLICISFSHQFNIQREYKFVLSQTKADSNFSFMDYISFISRQSTKQKPVTLLVRYFNKSLRLSNLYNLVEFPS